MNRLKELRNERGLSIRQMEIKTGINHASVSLYESEKRDMSTAILRQLSSFFEVTIDYLLCNNNYCIYAKYKEGNISFKIKEDYYKELKEKKYIYFDNNENRCIDINSLIGVNDSKSVVALIEEFTRIEKIDELFDSGKAKESDFEKLDDITEFELTKSFINKIKKGLE